MQWAKRIFFFLAVNILVVTTLSIIVGFLGLSPRLTESGYDMGSLIGFCLVWGMGGAFISLLLSKVMAKWMMGVRIIEPHAASGADREIVDMVHRFAKAAGLSTMPEVGIYESPEVNAFATGPSRNNSLVAVSRGLLQSMDKTAVEGVVGHEVAHIANGDMVTMTLLQGVVNAFVMALARIIAFAISNLLRGDREGEGLGPMAYMATVFVLEIVLMLLGSLVVFWFSRQREFRADQGGAKFAGRSSMIHALRSLDRATDRNGRVAQAAGDKPAMATLKISSGKSSGFMNLFRTHPSLEERIQRLERGLV